MANERCVKCSMPIDESTHCKCEPSVCYHCCSCDENCSCGCKVREKAEKKQ